MLGSTDENMSIILKLGEYISRRCIYVISDKKRCLYIGETTRGIAGVAGRITRHLQNSRQGHIGELHRELNRKDKPKDWYLNWDLKIFSIKECSKLTGKTLNTTKQAQEAMIELLKPGSNVQKR